MNTLNERCSLGEKARWEPGPGNLPVLKLRSELCTAQVFAHGAHVAQWKPSQHDEVLFLSKNSSYANGKAIRGGIPICFPWFGPRSNDPLPNGKPSPQHGFARNRSWNPIAIKEHTNGTIELTCALTPDEETTTLWKPSMEVLLSVLFGSELEVRLSVKNTSNETFDYEDALHTYLHVGDVTATTIEGFHGYHYLDKLDQNQRKPHTETSLTTAADRVYFDHEETVRLKTPTRIITIEKTGSRTTVLWNPWREKAQSMADLHPESWKEFVCIEAVNAGSNAVKLAPQEMHTTVQRISVSRA